MPFHRRVLTRLGQPATGLLCLVWRSLARVALTMLSSTHLLQRNISHHLRGCVTFPWVDCHSRLLLLLLLLESKAYMLGTGPIGSDVLYHVFLGDFVFRLAKKAPVVVRLRKKILLCCYAAVDPPDS